MDTSRCEISRRRLVGGLVGLAVDSPMQAQPPFRPIELNHITLNVSDLEESRAFYRKLFGGPQWTVPPNTSGNVFDLGTNPFGLYLNSRGKPIGTNHFCLAVPGFKADAAVFFLKQHSIESDQSENGVGVQFRDPDGIVVELVPPNYHNQRALLNESRQPVQPLFRPLGLNHITLQVSSLDRSTTFYESLFGASKGGRGRTATFGNGKLGWITYGVNPIGVDHFCVSVEGYEAIAVAKRLSENGIASQRLYERNQVFVRDPDGMLVQLA